MANIKLMDEVLANKIAAGEVVEKTMNVVKELVENSIDAESTIIEVELISSGVKEIKVIDNGVGMDKEDAKLAFSRHATSKLFTMDDLFNIETLGFRGEALPSIASVSKVSLTTSNGKEGTSINLDGGKIVDITGSSLAKGTTITVNDLFYNTPVRLKYLRNLNIELASIIDYLHKMSLAHPDIKFSLKNDQKLVFKTDGSGDLLKAIYNIYGVDVAKKMIEITSENDDYYINGYISYPEVTRSTRSEITTLVNGRVIKNNKLNKAIINSYHTYIPKDKFPIIVLNIDVDPYLIDINIHPTKMDIKFSKFDQLEKLISDTIGNQLKKLTLIPTVSVRDRESIEEVEVKDIKKEKVESEIKYEEMTFDFEVAEKGTETNYEESKMKKMIPRGIVYKTYIVAENEDGMYIIDQHAAAERINYEKVLKEALVDKKIKINLLVPIKIELPLNEYILIKEKINILEDLGFSIEEFGTNTFIIRTHPIWIKEEYEEEDIRKVIDILLENEEFELERFIYKISATQACRMSIKANDYISYEDQVYLLDELSKCENPFTCPHGRPTVIKYTKYDLEKLFKRAID